VRSTFERLAPQADNVAVLFYSRLFELDPALRPMFKPDMAEQRSKLMAMLATGIGSLDRIDALRPALQALGARHLTYGVREAHYDTVGTALLDTLEKGLGNAFTPGARAAWVEAYGLMAGAMKAGAALAQARDSVTTNLEGALHGIHPVLH